MQNLDSRPLDDIASEANIILQRPKYQLRLNPENHLFIGKPTTLAEAYSSRFIIDKELAHFYKHNPEAMMKYIREIVIPSMCGNPELRHVIEAAAIIFSRQKGNIIITDEASEVLASPDSAGFYTGKHSIYINQDTDRSGSIANQMGTLAHESLHMIFNHIKKNGAVPYGKTGDGETLLKAQLANVLEKDHTIQRSLNVENLSPDESYVHDMFIKYLRNSLFYFPKGCDPKNEENATLLHIESIVRIMQAVARGVPDDTIKKIAPNLYKFYMESCKGEIETWIAEHRADLRVLQEPAPSEQLTSMLSSADEQTDPELKILSMKSICQLARAHGLLDSIIPELISIGATLTDSRVKSDFHLALYQQMNSDETRRVVIQALLANNKDSFLLLAEIYKVTSDVDLKVFLFEELRNIARITPLRSPEKIELLRVLFDLTTDKDLKKEFLQEMRSLIQSTPLRLPEKIRLLQMIFTLTTDKDLKADTLEEMKGLARTPTLASDKVKLLKILFLSIPSLDAKSKILEEMVTLTEGDVEKR
ncbi:MAG: hypothetical protein NTX49_10360, partial [Chlamydiae bacterium]|nr:hypothetical protein [Chlamydiota bacterium]